MSRRPYLLLSLLALLAGCDQLGLEPASVTAARVEADGKAVGAACRYSGRAIEDCFALNRKTDKAAIYAGWRDMDDYMRENKIAVVPATVADGGHKAASDDADEAPAASAAAADKVADAQAAAPAAKGDKPASATKAAKAAASR